VKTTFIKKVYAKKAKSPPKRVTIRGKNLVDKDKNSGSRVKLVVQPKKIALPQKGLPIPRNKSRPKYPDQIAPIANGLKAHNTTGAASWICSIFCRYELLLFRKVKYPSRNE